MDKKGYSSLLTDDEDDEKDFAENSKTPSSPRTSTRKKEVNAEWEDEKTSINVLVLSWSAGKAKWSYSERSFQWYPLHSHRVQRKRSNSRLTFTVTIAVPSSLCGPCKKLLEQTRIPICYSHQSTLNGVARCVQKNQEISELWIVRSSRELARKSWKNTVSGWSQIDNISVVGRKGKVSTYLIKSKLILVLTHNNLIYCIQ